MEDEQLLTAIATNIFPNVQFFKEWRLLNVLQELILEGLDSLDSLFCSRNRLSWIILLTIPFSTLAVGESGESVMVFFF